MSTAILTVPVPARGGAAVGRRDPRAAGGRRQEPRLLLPPVAEPTGPNGSAAPASLSPPPLRSVLSPVTEAPWPLATPRSADAEAPLPDPTRLCGSLVLAAVEVLAGIRPLTQLTRWVSPEVLEALTNRIRTTSAAVVTPRATIRRTRLSRVSDRAVEAGVVLHDGSRVRAAALRLEVHRGHWRATVLQIG